MGATRLAINRPIAILMVVAAFLVLGFVSYLRLPAELNPKVDFPVVSVNTTYAGTNPQEMETLITKPIEDSISGVSGLKQIDSTSQSGVSVVTVYVLLRDEPRHGGGGRAAEGGRGPASGCRSTPTAPASPSRTTPRSPSCTSP